MKEFTPEMIEQAKTAKTVEELSKMAKAADIELTAEEAALPGWTNYAPIK